MLNILNLYIQNKSILSCLNSHFYSEAAFDHHVCKQSFSRILVCLMWALDLSWAHHLNGVSTTIPLTCVCMEMCVKYVILHFKRLFVDAPHRYRLWKWKDTRLSPLRQHGLYSKCIWALRSSQSVSVSSPLPDTLSRLSCCDMFLLCRVWPHWGFSLPFLPTF